MERITLRSPEDRVPGSTLARWGTRAWQLLGLLLATVAVLWLLSLVSGIVVPLVLAAVLGALFAPVVERLRRAGLPVPAGASLVLLGLAAVVIGSVWLVVAGVLDQATQISAQLAASGRTGRSFLKPFILRILLLFAPKAYGPARTAETEATARKGASGSPGS